MSVGVLLRQARESVGMSIEELSEITSVRRRVISDLESDSFESSGGLAYARGHIRIIAKALHANSDLLVEEFNVMNQDFNRPMIELLNENNVIPVLRKESKVSFILMAKAAAVIVALLIAVPTALTQGAGTTSTTGSAPTDPTVVATKSAPVVVIVTASGGSTWLAVSDSSGAQLFSGMLKHGTARSFDDTQLINLTIGNAGAVNLNVNGKDSGTPGATGEVVHLQFGPGASSQG
jgi:cytoskeleton protein RodZ